MLPGVLLHVIESTRPIDRALHGRTDGEAHVDQVGDLAVFAIEYLEHTRRTNRASVERLTTGRRIEGCLIEQQLQTPVAWLARDDARTEKCAVWLRSEE